MRLLAHDWLLMNHCQWRRGLALSPACSRCEEMREDALPLIRHYKSSKPVWECFLPSHLIRVFWSGLRVMAFLEFKMEGTPRVGE